MHVRGNIAVMFQVTLYVLHWIISSDVSVIPSVLVCVILPVYLSVSDGIQRYVRCYFRGISRPTGGVRRESVTFVLSHN